jgi:hypothetical protein
MTWILDIKEYQRRIEEMAKEIRREREADKSMAIRLLAERIAPYWER